jgi:hypothetical protein
MNLILHFLIRQEYEYPSVLLGVFVKTNQSHLEEFMNKLVSLNYPPRKIQIFLYKQVNFLLSGTPIMTSIKHFQDELLTNITDKYLHHYAGIKTIHNISEESAKEMAV